MPLSPHNQMAYLSFFFDNNFDAVLPTVIGVCTDGVPALHNTVFNVSVVSEIYII